MCGRYSLAADLEDIQQRFELFAGDLSYSPRYNIAPTQPVLAVTNDEGGAGRVHALGAYSFLGQECLGGQPPNQCAGRDRGGTAQFSDCIGTQALLGPR